MELKARKDMNPDFTWDLTPIFPDKDAWEKECAEMAEIAKDLAKYNGKIAESADTMAEALDAIYAAAERLERVYIYAMLNKDLDGGDPEAQAMNAKAEKVMTIFYATIAYVEPELLAAPAEVISENLKLEKLKEYRFYVSDLLRKKEHMLDKEREEMLAQLSEVSSVPRSAYGMLSNVDMPLPKVKNAEGEEVQLTHGNFGVFRECADRAVREGAFDAMFGTHKQYINTISTLYAGYVKMHEFTSNVRKYATPREMSLFSHNVPVSVYDSLIEAVHDGLPAMRKYLELRKKVLKLEKMDYYDLYVPMLTDTDMSISYEEGKKLGLAAVEPLGSDYQEMFKVAYENKWMDVYENKGKRSGAYSCGVYGVHPYILLNYADKLDDAFTLVHELGHAMHSYYSSEAQSYVNHDYCIMAAEVASTVNEVLLTKYLLKTETDLKKRAAVLNHFLEGFRTTIFRQTLFAEFEREAFKMYEEGTPLTAKSLSDLYYNLCSTYYEGIGIPENVAYEWAFIPHFYMGFYVYQYATGLSSAVSIVDKILETGDASGYRKFLTLGGSDYPIEELKVAGIDLTKPDTVKNAIKMFESTVDELSELLDKIQ